MSRVADALKRANTMNEELAPAGDSGLGSPQPSDFQAVKKAIEKEEIAPKEHPPEEPRGLAARVLGNRWTQQILRLLHITYRSPVPGCSGMTSQGQSSGPRL